MHVTKFLNTTGIDSGLLLPSAEIPVSIERVIDTAKLRRKMVVMYARMLRVPSGSFFLLGPRGTGKSTWLKKQFKHAFYVDLLDQGLFQRLVAHPNEFYEMLTEQRAGSWVVVDEIQRAPMLLNEVHRLIENKKLKFALSGSSARKLRRAGVNLLAGRALQKFMHPLLPSEMGKAYDLEHALKRGTLPLVVDADSPEDTLGAYTQLYLREEIQAEALVRDLGGFARFLPLAGLFHAQYLNLSGLGRDAEVSRATVRGYLDILRDTLIARTLPAYTSTLRVREKQHPKLYFIDSGIARSAKGLTGPVAPEERGALFEGLIYQLLAAHQDYQRIFDEIYYWSPAEAKHTEVDFLLARGKKFVAIEVKSASKVASAELRGLRAITELKGLERRILVYAGSRTRTTEDGIEIMPFHRFEKNIARI